MRILTGDECGLLKEVIPEISRNANPTERGMVQASADCEGVSRLDLQLPWLSHERTLDGSKGNGVL